MDEHSSQVMNIQGMLIFVGDAHRASRRISTKVGRPYIHTLFTLFTLVNTDRPYTLRYIVLITLLAFYFISSNISVNPVEQEEVAQIYYAHQRHIWTQMIYLRFCVDFS